MSTATVARHAGADVAMGLTDQDYGSREFAVSDPRGQPLELRHLPPVGGLTRESFRVQAVLRCGG